MKLRSIALSLSLPVIGIVIGGTGSHYWNQQMRKAESALALDEEQRSR